MPFGVEVDRTIAAHAEAGRVPLRGNELAFRVHRVMHSRLRAAHSGLTPERALEQLRRIQHHRIRINGTDPVTGVSSINDEQNEVLHALRVKKPVAAQQLTLL